MKSLAGIGTLSILMAVLASPICADDQPPSQVSALLEKTLLEKPKPPITISKETTYLTEPLTQDGYVDYVAAINKMCSEGVTAENNAVVLLLEAVGPNIIHEPHRPKYFQMLGVAPLPEKGDYLISIETFLQEIQSEQQESEDEAEAAEQRAQKQEEINKFHNSMTTPWMAAEYPRYAEWLKANQKPLEKIYEAVQRRKYYAPLISDESDGYTPVIAMLLEIVQELRACARLLMAHAMYSIGEGKNEDARRDILACHRLARLMGQGSTLVETLVAFAIDGMACKGDVMLAQSGKLTAREAASFREELRKLPPMPKVADKIDKTERFVFLDCAAMMAKNGLTAVTSEIMGGGEKEQNPLKAILASSISSAINWDIVFQMGNARFDRIMDAVREPTFARRAAAWEKLESEFRQIGGEVRSVKSLGDSLMTGESLRSIMSKRLGNIFLSLLTPNLSAAIQAEERSYVYSDLSQIALALAAYHRDNGRYPDRLADLAPKYLPELPKDRFADADYVYRREVNGYLLYSVGANGKDDGGKSRQNEPPDEEGDDFVVRTPKEAK